MGAKLRKKNIILIFFLFFARLFVSLQPNNQIINKKMDDYPADNYNS